MNQHFLQVSKDTIALSDAGYNRWLQIVNGIREGDPQVTMARSATVEQIDEELAIAGWITARRRGIYTFIIPTTLGLLQAYDLRINTDRVRASDMPLDWVIASAKVRTGPTREAMLKAEWEPAGQMDGENLVGQYILEGGTGGKRRTAAKNADGNWEWEVEGVHNVGTNADPIDEHYWLVATGKAPEPKAEEAFDVFEQMVMAMLGAKFNRAGQCDCPNCRAKRRAAGATN